MITAPISPAEVRSVQEGVAHDVREDGRTLLQRRPAQVRTHVMKSIGAGEHFDGSSVSVKLFETVVLAAARASVVEVAPHAGNVGATEAPPEEDCPGRGQLYIGIDAVPSVVDFYAHALGAHCGRYRRGYMAFLAQSIREAFGAVSVTVQEPLSGLAEAQPIAEDVAETAEEAAPAEEATAMGAGFPAEDLYVGRGFAFRIDVDVHILQAVSGNVLSCVSLAVHAALKAMQLPCVTLHEAPAGVSVEVDRSKPFSRAVDWSQLPVLALLLLSPTRHYVVDPTAREELALPTQLHVAANGDGRVSVVRRQRWPSRRGDVYRVGGDGGETGEVTEGRTFAWDVQSLTDGLAAVSDAVHVCQAMIAECDEALQAEV